MYLFIYYILFVTFYDFFLLRVDCFLKSRRILFNFVHPQIKYIKRRYIVFFSLSIKVLWPEVVWFIRILLFVFNFFCRENYIRFSSIVMSIFLDIQITSTISILDVINLLSQWRNVFDSFWLLKLPILFCFSKCLVWRPTNIIKNMKTGRLRRVRRFNRMKNCTVDRVRTSRSSNVRSNCDSKEGEATERVRGRIWAQSMWVS